MIRVGVYPDAPEAAPQIKAAGDQTHDRLYRRPRRRL